MFAKALCQRLTVLLFVGMLGNASPSSFAQVTIFVPPQVKSTLESIIQRARTEREQKKYDSAIKTLEAGLASMPNQPDLCLMMADTLGEAGKHAKAMEYFDIALKQATPGSFLRISSLNNSAWILATSPNTKVRNGKLAVKRSKECLASIGQKPKYQSLLPTVYDTLGAGFAETGDFAKAIVAAGQAIERLPKDEEEYRRAFRESADRLTDRLSLYRLGKPFRQPTQKESCQ